MTNTTIQLFGKPVLITFKEIFEIDGIGYQVIGPSRNVLEKVCVLPSGELLPYTDTYFWCDIIIPPHAKFTEWLRGRRKIEVQGSILQQPLCAKPKPSPTRHDSSRAPRQRPALPAFLFLIRLRTSPGKLE
jgi:hypothetical protein